MAEFEKFRRLQGSNNEYVEIGKRDNDRIAVSMMYAEHPHTHVSHLIVRFVAYGAPETVATLKMKHFIIREYAKLLDLTLEQNVKALRLNRAYIPLFSAGLGLGEVIKLGKDHQLWPIIGGWIKEQLTLEGFECLIPDTELEAFVLAFLPEPAPATMILELPDLANVKAAASVHSDSTVGEQNLGEPNEDEPQY